jgi:F-type H+-transporting ATPase subunit b
MTDIFHVAGFWVAVSFVLFFVLVGKKLWTPLSRPFWTAARILIREELDEAARPASRSRADARGRHA